MPRDFVITGLHVNTPNVACAHECRYCLWGEKQHTKLPFSRAARLIERLAEWKHANKPQEFSLTFLAGFATNTAIEELRERNELNKRIGNGPRYRGMALGGLRFRSPGAQSEWMKGLRDLGVEVLHASFAGHGAVHDYWNGRKGDFDHLMALMRRGAEIGIRSEQTFFLIKSTIHLLEDLRGIMEAEFGEMAKYHVRTFNYMGAAKAFEDERITEDMRDSMSDWVNKVCLGDRFTEWRSEREWMDLVSQEPEAVEKVVLKLFVTDANIEQLEAMSAQRIFGELEAQARINYNRLSSLKDLAARFGDPTNTRVYQDKWCIGALWQGRADSSAASLSYYSDLFNEMPARFKPAQFTTAG